MVSLHHLQCKTALSSVLDDEDSEDEEEVFPIGNAINRISNTLCANKSRTLCHSFGTNLGIIKVSPMVRDNVTKNNMELSYLIHNVRLVINPIRMQK